MSSQAERLLASRPNSDRTQGSHFVKKSITRSKYKEIFAELRDKIETASRQFPAGVEPPIFDDKRDPAAFSLMVALKWLRVPSDFR